MILYLPTREARKQLGSASLFFEPNARGKNSRCAAKNMRWIMQAKKLNRTLLLAMAKGGEGAGWAHLESLPSLWKASGLEPSFMNFMVKTEGMLSHDASASSLCSTSSACCFAATTSLQLQLSVLVPCLHFTPPPACVVPLVLSLLCSENSGDQPGNQRTSWP